MKSLSTFLLVIILSACASSPIKDMSSYEFDDFRKENLCNKTSQCKSVLWGIGECGNYPHGAAGYFIYSSKIGYKNIKRLKKLAKESLPINDTYRTNMSDSYELVECLPIGMKKPRLACIDNTCQETW